MEKVEYTEYFTSTRSTARLLLLVKALMVIGRVKIGDVEYMLGEDNINNDGGLCLCRVARVYHDINESPVSETLIKDDLAFSALVRLAESMTDKEVDIIGSNVGINAERYLKHDKCSV